MWSNLCICSPGVVELVRSNLAPDFPLFHEWSPHHHAARLVLHPDGGLQRPQFKGSSGKSCRESFLNMAEELFSQHEEGIVHSLSQKFLDGIFQYCKRVNSLSTFCLHVFKMRPRQNMAHIHKVSRINCESAKGLRKNKKIYSWVGPG